MCTALFGCRAETVQTATTAASTTAAVTDTHFGFEQVSEKTTTEKSTDKSTTASTVNETSSQTETSTTEKQKTTKTETTEKTTEKTTAKKEKTTSVKTTSATTSTADEINCTIEIECKKIFDNIGDLKPGHEEYLGDNGVILGEYSVTLKDGASAYTLLQTACDENGIHLAAKRTLYGTYITGINYIDEKDCGDKSGWLYYVNGELPNISAGSYTLKDGDRVVFSYTCTY